MHDLNLKGVSLMNIKEKIRTIPNFPEKGIMYRDISTLFNNSDGLQEVTQNFLKRYKNSNDFDLIVGIEARGFIVGSILAHALKKGFVMIRKPGKLPGKVFSEEYKLEYGLDKMEIQTDAFKPGSKILLVDDLLATGGTILSAISLVERLGGKIYETAFIIDIPELGGSTELSDKGIVVFSLVQFEGH